MFYQRNRKYVEPSRLQSYYNQYMKEAEDTFNTQFPKKNIIVGLNQSECYQID